MISDKINISQVSLCSDLNRKEKNKHISLPSKKFHFFSLCLYTCSKDTQVLNYLYKIISVFDVFLSLPLTLTHKEIWVSEIKIQLKTKQQ